MASRPTAVSTALLLFLLFLGASFAATWSSDGNGGVYWNNSIAKISVYPAVSDDLIQHVQYANFSYNGSSPLTTNLSFVFPFQINGARAELWTNITTQQQVAGQGRTLSTYFYYNVSNITAANASNCQIGDSQDLSAYSFLSNGTQVVACFDSYTNNGSTYVLNVSKNGTVYSLQNVTAPGWKDISGLFSRTQISGQDVFTINNVAFTNQTLYQTRLTYNVPINASAGKFSIYVYQGTPQQVASGQVIPLLVLDPWWNTSWVNKLQFNVTNKNPTEDEIWFPAPISINTSNTSQFNLTTGCNNIRVLDSTETILLNYEWDSNSSTFCTSSTNNGTLYVGGNWTHNSNTSVYVYVANLPATNGANPIFLWQNASYVGVWHMNQNTTLIDSAGYDNLSYIGNGRASIVNGKFGNAINVSSSGVANVNTAFVNFSVSSKLTNQNNITYSAWAQSTATGSSDASGMSAVMDYGKAGNMVAMGPTIALDAIIIDGYGTPRPTVGPWNNNSFNYMADSWAGLTNQVIYSNLTANSSSVFSRGAAATGNLTLFNYTAIVAGGAIGWINGSIDEARIRNTTSTPGWLAAEYGNITSSFVAQLRNSAVNPTLQPSPAYYPTTIQGYENDSSNGLNASTINWTLYVNGSNYTSGSLTNGTLGFPPQNISLFNLSQFTYNTNLTLFVWENRTDGSSDSANSSNLTISKSPLVISSINLTPATSYPNSTLVCTSVLLDNDTYAPYQPINGSISWLKNGVNQTGLFTSLNFTNGIANSTSYTPAGGFNVSDNWTCQIFANDTNLQAGPTNSTNTTITDYISNTTMNSTTQEFDLYNYTHFLNFTVTAGANVTAINVTFNGGNSTATFSNISGQYTANITLQPTFTNTLYNTTINWTVYLTPTVGPNYSEKFISNYNITVNASGIYGCNATYPFITTAINYSYYDTSNLAAINATMSATYSVTSSNGTVKTISYPAVQNLTQAICVVPPSGSFPTVATETVNATGYTGLTIIEPSQLYNSTLIQRPIGLTNTTLGAYYTLQVSNIYSAFIQGASIVAGHYLSANNTWVFFQASITDSTGSAPFFMIPANLYNFTISAPGFNTNHFNFTPASNFLVSIQLTQNSSASSNNSSTSFDNLWNTTSWSVTPVGSYFNATKTICFTVNSTGTSMASFGLLIFLNQTILVYNSTSSSSTGGALCYVAHPTGYYEINPSITPINGSTYYVIPTQIFVTNGDVGLAFVRDTLVGGSFVDGWTWFFIGACCAVGVGIGVSIKSPLAGAGAGCLVLLFFGVMAAPDMVIWGPVNPLEGAVVITFLVAAMTWMFGYQG